MSYDVIVQHSGDNGVTVSEQYLEATFESLSSAREYANAIRGKPDRWNFYAYVGVLEDSEWHERPSWREVEDDAVPLRATLRA